MNASMHEKQQALDSPLSALAQLALLYRTPGTVTKEQFVKICRSAALGCQDRGDHTGRKCLEAIASRLK